MSYDRVELSRPGAAGGRTVSYATHDGRAVLVVSWPMGDVDCFQVAGRIATHTIHVDVVQRGRSVQVLFERSGHGEDGLVVGGDCGGSPGGDGGSAPGGASRVAAEEALDAEIREEVVDLRDLLGYWEPTGSE